MIKIELFNGGFYYLKDKRRIISVYDMFDNTDCGSIKAGSCIVIETDSGNIEIHAKDDSETVAMFLWQR